jgi:hypothetical protein
MSYNIMIGYDFYDHFTVEHFTLRQSIILTTSFFLLVTVCTYGWLQKKRELSEKVLSDFITFL